MEDEQWQTAEGVDQLSLQPFYHVLIDSRDRWPGRAGGARDQQSLPVLAYVPQDCLDAPEACPFLKQPGM